VKEINADDIVLTKDGAAEKKQRLLSLICNPVISWITLLPQNRILPMT